MCIRDRARPALILLDVVMPGTDGIEACRQLKVGEATREIPVIFITGHAETAARVEGFRAGAVDYIVKPFAAGEVLALSLIHI